MNLDLEISTPWMNTAGTLGFSPPVHWNCPHPAGAFVTNPISLSPRTPAQNRALLAYPGGYLLHSGLPNPGLKTILRRHAPAWARASLPIWVHLLAEKPEEVHAMALELETVEGVAALEIGIPPQAQPAQALDLLQAALGELPVIAALPLHLVAQPWVEKLPQLGLRALTLTGPRGTLPGADGALISGRLYGPGLFPQILHALRQLQPLGLPLIAGAGVYSLTDAQTLFQSGAQAIQLDSLLWK